MIKKALLVANGFPPSLRLISSLKNIGYKHLVGIDGGNNYLNKMNLFPDLVIGDLDSVNLELLNELQKKTKVIQLKRQNDTDVEKAIKYLIKKKFNDTVLIGGTGNRLDHSIANIGFVLKYFDKIKISLIHSQSILIPYSGEIELSCLINETISLYTFSPDTIVSSDGLKYKLDETSLMLGVKDSTSNVAIKNYIKLKIGNGIVCVVRDLKTVIENGLL